MIVYRITLAKHAGKLTASGNAARWNSKDVAIIYTASSRSLACLENVVHRSSRGLQENFRTVIIEIPNSLKILMIDRKDLLREWKQFGNMPYTQSMGDKWVKEAISPVLRVPSVIIPEEYNYLLNTSHKDFGKIKYLGSEPFTFDNRLKQ
ncbi:MAG: RES family NAD+ phosphorylase [Chitinophagaceae bacterium]